VRIPSVPGSKRKGRLRVESTHCGNAASRAHLRHPRGGVRRLELDLLRQAQRIIDLDPKITDRALDLRVSKKQLDRSQIAGLAVDLRRLGAAQRMRAVGRALHPGTLDPAVHYARVLASREMGLVVDSARKDVGTSICRAHVQPVLQRGSGLFRDLKLNRTAGLVLDDRRPVSHVAARSYVIARTVIASPNSTERSDPSLHAGQATASVEGSPVLANATRQSDILSASSRSYGVQWRVLRNRFNASCVSNQ
jgi:hypothetical protein